MVGNFFLTFIVVCMAILVGYPLFKWLSDSKRLAGSVRSRERERRKA